jgi:geranyl-CoA carboxylase beta subunit
MPAIESKIDARSEIFRKNREDMLALVADFRALEAKVRDLSDAKRETFRKRGQLLPRERVALLLDRGAPWL